LTKKSLLFFREAFLGFDPFAVSKLNEKKLVMPGSSATFLLSETKIRAVIDNSRQILKVFPFYILLIHGMPIEFWLFYLNHINSEPMLPTNKGHYQAASIHPFLGYKTPF
jgi:Methyladenine glycosylase